MGQDTKRTEEDDGAKAINQFTAEYYTFQADVSQPSEGSRVLDEAQWSLQGHVYYDGSCEQLREPPAASAALAFAALALVFQTCLRYCRVLRRVCPFMLAS